MTKPIIAVDIDDVLLPHFQDLISWHNDTYGTSLTLADNGSEDLEKWGGGPIEQAILRVHTFFDSKDFQEAQPFNDAQKVLAKLCQKYELIVVTARDTIIEAITKEWLNIHFPDLFQTVHFTAKYSLEGKRRQKVDVLRQLQAEYLIDDDLGNATAAIQAGAQGILFGDYPWNKSNVLPANVIRCKSWAAVLEYFEVKTDA